MGDIKGARGIGFKKGLDNLTCLSFRAVTSGRDDRNFQVFSEPGRETGGISLGYVFAYWDKDVVPFILGVNPGKRM